MQQNSQNCHLISTWFFLPNKLLVRFQSYMMHLRTSQNFLSSIPFHQILMVFLVGGGSFHLENMSQVGSFLQGRGKKCSKITNTLLGTNISPKEGTFELMIFRFPGWDMYAGSLERTENHPQVLLTKPTKTFGLKQFPHSLCITMTRSPSQTCPLRLAAKLAAMCGTCLVFNTELRPHKIPLRNMSGQRIWYTEGVA